MSAIPDNLAGVSNPAALSSLHDTIMSSAKQAYEMQGAYSLANPRENTVCHEIGHAINYVVEGVGVSCIEVFEPESRWARKRKLDQIAKRARKNGNSVDQAMLRDLLNLPSWCGWTHAAEGCGTGPFSYRPGDSHDHLRRLIRFTISGYCGELALYRGKQPLSSSLDEVALSQSLAANFGPSALDEWSDLFIECGYMIKENKSVADELIEMFATRDKLAGPDLQAVLAKIDTKSWREKMKAMAA